MQARSGIVALLLPSSQLCGEHLGIGQAAIGASAVAVKLKIAEPKAYSWAQLSGAGAGPCGNRFHYVTVHRWRGVSRGCGFLRGEDCRIRRVSTFAVIEVAILAFAGRGTATNGNAEDEVSGSVQ